MGFQKTLFLSEFYPPLVGGTCNKFSNRFGLYPPEQIVVLTKRVEDAEIFDNTVQYPIIRVPLHDNPNLKGFEYMGVVWQLINASLPVVKKQKIKVIECARPLPEGVAGYVVAKLLRKKLVINFQGEDISVLQNYKVERFLLKTVSRAAQLNITNSSFTELLVKQLTDQQAKTGVVTPGFNPGRLEQPEPEKIAALREKLGGRPIILTVGRLQQRKGQDNVVRALPYLIPHFPNLKYVIVGSTHGGTTGFTEKLQKLITELQLNEHVLLVGEVANEELPVYYAASDLFIMANRLEPGGDVEGFGAVFLEAGFFQKPVIGGNSGGVPDAIQHEKTGLLVNGTSVEEIARGIDTVLSNNQLARKMGEQGRAFALSLTHENVFAHYRNLTNHVY